MARGFDNYEKLVLQAYLQKRADDSLPIGLMVPTPASLRDECLRACRNRFLKKDEKAIRDFFVEESNSKTCLEIIEHCDINKFKQIIKYLKRGGGIKTKEKNILLLAWLIDFKERPYEYDREYDVALVDVVKVKDEEQDNDNPDPETVIVDGGFTAEEKKDVGESLGDGVERGILSGSKGSSVPGKAKQASSVSGSIGPEAFATSADDVKKVKPKLRIRGFVVIGALLLVIGGGGYWWWGTTPESDGGCMYWADDHYEPIPCNQKVPNKLVIALDTVKVRNFKKITLPDTITNRAKGYVWYSKINNKYEFFTADGEHPIVFNKPLKPITDYIIDKHIKPGMTSN